MRGIEIERKGIKRREERMDKIDAIVWIWMALWIVAWALIFMEG